METSSIPADLSNWGETKLKELSVEALRTLCTEKHIGTKTKMKKEELVDLLLEWVQNNLLTILAGQIKFIYNFSKLIFRKRNKQYIRKLHRRNQA